jgi:cyclic beta-1,2-glucan synthetase
VKSLILRALKGVSTGFPQETDEPIRAELFSIERLEQHAESLAEAQRSRPDVALAEGGAERLRDNGRVLIEG